METITVLGKIIRKRNRDSILIAYLNRFSGL